MINKLKSQKGITGIDLTLSLILIMIFISIIASLSLNASTSLASKRRLELLSNCITQIMEKLDGIPYENVVISDTESENTVSNIKQSNTNNYSENTFEHEVQKILNNKEEYKIFAIDIVKEKYIPEGEVDDLVKKITIKITYNLNNQDEKIEVTRLKTKYNVDL